MTSISSFGTMNITLQFVPDWDIDAAAGRASGDERRKGVPTGMPSPPIYSKVNPADTPILTLQITSDSLPLEKVNDLADTVLAQKLSEVSGVGLVTIEGNRETRRARARGSGGAFRNWHRTGRCPELRW